MLLIRCRHLPDTNAEVLDSTAAAPGLAAGFGVRCGIVGARGMDENGAFFQSSLKRSHVNTDRLRVLKGGATGACAILLSGSGNCACFAALRRPPL